MRLNRAERELFRKRLENFFVKNLKIKQCDVVDHFIKEGIARQTSYNALNRRKNGQLTVEESQIFYILYIVYKGKVKATRKQSERKKSWAAKVGRQI